ncbi:MAG: DUF2911 domain-containing protein [Acidobacteria bacterium]|nr:DUF2911 domain-containing protein [Acidobacteriota bacterium]
MIQRRAFVASALVAALAVPAGLVAAQEKRASPHETVKATIDGATVSVTYGRPYMKGRKVFGGLVPYGQVWRTGADEATILETDKALMIGPIHVNPGKVSLYTLIDASTWRLVLNKQTGQWGTEYAQAQDLARVAMKTETLSAPVEQFTIAIEKNPAGKGGVLVIQWETTKASVAFTTM